MGELKEVKIHLDDINKAIEVVTLFMGSVNIPGNRALDWSVTQKVLVDLKVFVEQEREKLPKKEEEVISA